MACTLICVGFTQAWPNIHSCCHLQSMCGEQPIHHQGFSTGFMHALLLQTLAPYLVLKWVKVHHQNLLNSFSANVITLIWAATTVLTTSKVPAVHTSSYGHESLLPGVYPLFCLSTSTVWVCMQVEWWHWLPVHRVLSVLGRRWPSHALWQKGFSWSGAVQQSTLILDILRILLEVKHSAEYSLPPLSQLYQAPVLHLTLLPLWEWLSPKRLCWMERSSPVLTCSTPWSQPSLWQVNFLTLLRWFCV